MVHKIKKFFKKRFQINPRLKRPSRAKTFFTGQLPGVQQFAFPGLGPAGGGVGVAKTVVSKTGGFIKGVGAKFQEFGKPFTLKSGIGKPGSRFIKGLGVVTGISAVDAAITGEAFNPLGRRPLLAAAGFAVGGLPAAAIGGLLGGTKKGFKEGGEIINLLNRPQIPAGFGGDGFTGIQQVPSNQVNIDFGDAPPISSGGVSGGGFAPSGVSFNIGGGGQDLSSLILLLLLGVGGGVGLTGIIKKRKKKKKKKKRKKLKRKIRELEEDEE